MLGGLALEDAIRMHEVNSTAALRQLRTYTGDAVRSFSEDRPVWRRGRCSLGVVFDAEHVSHPSHDPYYKGSNDT